jgi:hypothetical protein
VITHKTQITKNFDLLLLGTFGRAPQTPKSMSHSLRIYIHSAEQEGSLFARYTVYNVHVYAHGVSTRINRRYSHIRALYQEVNYNSQVPFMCDFQCFTREFPFLENGFLTFSYERFPFLEITQIPVSHVNSSFHHVKSSGHLQFSQGFLCSLEISHFTRDFFLFICDLSRALFTLELHSILCVTHILSRAILIFPRVNFTRAIFI